MMHLYHHYMQIYRYKDFNSPFTAQQLSVDSFNTYVFLPVFDIGMMAFVYVKHYEVHAIVSLISNNS